MVVKNPQQQPINDKTFNETIFKVEFYNEDDEDQPEPDTENEDEDDNDIIEIQDDNDYDKDLIRIIRKRYPKSSFLHWLTSKRNRSSS